MDDDDKLPPHPGEVLIDWMQGRQQSLRETASLLGIATAELARLLAGEAPLSPKVAVHLEHIGWGSAESWLGTQVVRDVAEARLQLPQRSPTILPPRHLDLGFNIYHRTGRRPQPRYRPPCSSIVVACRGPEQPKPIETRFGEMRSREGALLAHTANDAEQVHERWKKDEPEIPDDLTVLLIDPTLAQLTSTLRRVSRRLRDAYPNDIGLDFFFAGHGASHTGNLVLRDGVLTPRLLLGLQAQDMDPEQPERTVGVWLDSCHSGAFLIRLANQAFKDFPGVRLDEGLASCLPNEVCFEMNSLQHGVFTYTRLHPGNRHVDAQHFNAAILRNDNDEIAKGLQGLVGMTGSPTAFLTEGQQFSMSLTKHFLTVDGDYATAELGETSDLAELASKLTAFKSN